MRATVVHIITKLELGGAQQNTLYTCDHLDKQRFEVKLISGPDGMLNEEARRIENIEFSIAESLVREIDPKKDAKALWNLTLYFKKLKQSRNLPIIVHTHSSKAGILGRTAAAAAGCDILIHSIHGFGFDASNLPFIKNAFKTAERVAAAYTDHFIAVSEANRRLGIKMNLFSERNSSLIRSGVNLSEFILDDRKRDEARTKIRTELGIPKNAPVAILIACFKPQKAPLDFVSAARIALKSQKNLQFILAGDGELRSSIEKSVSSAHISHSFRILGWRRDIPQLLAASDILVLTSRWEGLPRVIPQAMCAKLPIVATNVDGIPEAVIHKKNGILCSPGDVSGIAEGIVKLADDKKLRKAFGEEGFSRAAEWDIDEMVKKQEALYEKLLSEKGL
ncbi:MAG: glycosyltransferase family 4 protein [Myxococcota bacterium]